MWAFCGKTNIVQQAFREELVGQSAFIYGETVSEAVVNQGRNEALVCPFWPQETSFLPDRSSLTPSDQRSEYLKVNTLDWTPLSFFYPSSSHPSHFLITSISLSTTLLSWAAAFTCHFPVARLYLPHQPNALFYLKELPWASAERVMEGWWGLGGALHSFSRNVSLSCAIRNLFITMKFMPTGRISLHDWIDFNASGFNFLHEKGSKKTGTLKMLVFFYRLHK